ncbi:hypothetical protein Solca_0388 [Solitalea canadensis DSM 3403]|uniref:DUF4349 domain-containing protein n=2 Tax=Solitalea canadensis TaxID=995 RepID=H8KP06_SOLCM|nr:hypothetical protein Solca_0388 [Solitalea canadensis DSM 3403]
MSGELIEKYLRTNSLLNKIMKNIQQLVLISVLTLAITSCGQNHKAEMESMASADTAMISSSAAETGNDNGRKFIRTSELKFKVKSVADATFKIEDIARKEGGFVTLSNLTSSVDNVVTTKVSADSSVETKYYTVSNSIILRVPNYKLDTTLKQIAKLVDFLDYRVIKADDVGLQLLSNNMAQKRIAKNEQRLTDAIDQKGRKLNDVTNAEESLLDKNEQSDATKLSSLNLNDQINFSTVSLSVYQRETTKSELIVNNVNLKEYQQGFLSSAYESFLTGFEILSSIVLALIKLWSVILLASAAYFLYRKYGFKFKKEVR